VALEKERWGGGDSFSKSPIGLNLVGLFFTEPDAESKTSKPFDTETWFPRVGISQQRISSSTGLLTPNPISLHLLNQSVAA